MDELCNDLLIVVTQPYVDSRKLVWLRPRNLITNVQIHSGCAVWRVATELSRKACP